VIDGGPAGRTGATQRELVVFGAVLRGGAQVVVAGLAISPRQKLDVR
jgi:hypothetical protein